MGTQLPDEGIGSPLAYPALAAMTAITAASAGISDLVRARRPYLVVIGATIEDRPQRPLTVRSTPDHIGGGGSPAFT
jgi:hypothetical protein